MKLYQILESVDDTLIRKVAELTHSFMNDTNKNANVIINAALYKWPELKYSGPMFRVIYVLSEVILKSNKNADILQYIKNYKGIKEIWAFSKTIQGLNQFLPYEEDPVTQEDISVGVVVSQNGIGLDIEKFYNKFQDYIAANQEKSRQTDNYKQIIWHRLHDATEAQEVNACLNNTLRISAYILRGLKGKGQIDRYGKEQKRMFIPKSYRFRADQLQQLKQSLRYQLSGKAKTIARKNPHPKSQIAQLDVVGTYRRGF